MKKIFFTAFVVLIFSILAPCTTFAVTRHEVEQIMHSIVPSSRLVTTAPIPSLDTSIPPEAPQQNSFAIEQVQQPSTIHSYENPTTHQSNNSFVFPTTTDGTSNAQPARQDNQVQGWTRSNPSAPNLTREEVFLACMNKMGWTYTLSLLRRLSRLPEFAKFSPIDFVCNNMKPAPPQELFGATNEIFPDSDLAKLREWIRKCVASVSIEANIALYGNTLNIIKKGVPAQLEGVQDMSATNPPLFIAYYTYNPRQNSAQVTLAKHYGADKLPLATIAANTEGAEFAINGGRFGAGKGEIIGALRSNGNTIERKFWGNRAGFAWNNFGEHLFFDASTLQNKAIMNNQTFDRFTEVFQAGPMLIFNGRIPKSKEDIPQGTIEKRHPRSFVAELADGTLAWGVVDGRDAIHSVGMTIDELRSFCKERNFVNALNLDGGSSSSVWWHGITFSKPCGKLASERKIPYAIVVYNAERSSRQFNAGQSTQANPQKKVIVIPKADDYSEKSNSPMNTTPPQYPQAPQQGQQLQDTHINPNNTQQENFQINNNTIITPHN